MNVSVSKEYMFAQRCSLTRRRRRSRRRRCRRRRFCFVAVGWFG